MTPQELASVLKEAVLAGVGVASVTVAAFGLSTWQRQLRGNADFETARQLAKATFALRDEIAFVRSPLMLAREFPKDYSSRGRNDAATEADAYAHVFSARLQPLYKAAGHFDAAALEAEALWGACARQRTDALRACLGTLNASIQALIDDKRSGGEIFRHNAEFGREMRANVAATVRSKDAFSEEIRAAVAGIEGPPQASPSQKLACLRVTSCLLRLAA